MQCSRKRIVVASAARNETSGVGVTSEVFVAVGVDAAYTVGVDDPSMVDKRAGIIYDTKMKTLQIVIDTNVLIAALRSRRGASFRLLSLIDQGKFQVNISVPLVLEYEDAAKRLLGKIALTTRDIDNVIDHICAVAQPRTIFYLWRPFLKDPKDDMVLELAVSAQCDYIVTFNRGDFEGVEQFGIQVITPQECLRKIGALS